MPGAKHTRVDSSSLARRFARRWAALTPWWWVYLPILGFEGVVFALYLGTWGSHDFNYAMIRIGTFVAIGIAAIDQAKHKSFYTARARSTNTGPGRLRRTLGWSLASVAFVFGITSAIMLGAGANEGGGSFALVGAIIGLAACYSLKIRPPKWLWGRRSRWRRSLNRQRYVRRDYEDLPTHDANGNPITYSEWDSHQPGPGQRGSERIVTGSDGSAWYTDDHYATFKQIR